MSPAPQPDWTAPARIPRSRGDSDPVYLRAWEHFQQARAAQRRAEAVLPETFDTADPGRAALIGEAAIEADVQAHEAMRQLRKAARRRDRVTGPFIRFIGWSIVVLCVGTVALIVLGLLGRALRWF